METDAAFVRAAGIVVLDAETGENFGFAVIHFYGNGNSELLHRLAYKGFGAGIKLEGIADIIEL
jgi:hypothetical protein